MLTKSADVIGVEKLSSFTHSRHPELLDRDVCRSSGHRAGIHYGSEAGFVHASLVGEVAPVSRRLKLGRQVVLLYVHQLQIVNES